MMFILPIFRKQLVCFLFLLLSVNVHGQTIKGKITDQQGKPIEYATIYIDEIKTGTITSESGEFIISLQPGTYTCIIQHLSYKTINKTIEIPQESILKIQMETKDILLREVTISSKEEDRAYSIIRKTVAKSPYYQRQLLKYTATYYGKGSVKVKDVPRLIGKVIEKEAQIKKGDVYTQESISEVTVTPQRTEQKVLSERSSYPKSLGVDGVSSFGYYNIYRDNTDFVSPVTKSGLSVYRYQWLYSYKDNELLIHHIKVIPRSNNFYTFSGYIDIIDGSWHVYNFDLSGSMDMGIAKMKFNIKENFVPVEDNVWMPGSLYEVFDVTAMRCNFIMSMTSSIRYKNYEVNPVLNSPNPAAEVIPMTSTPRKEPIISKKSEKLTKEITEITEKEKLTTRDAIKLVDLYEAKNKEDLKNNPINDSINSLELQKRYFVTKDSNASVYDTVLWDNYRTIPLSEEEITGFEQKQVKDSILDEKDKEREAKASKKKSLNLFKKKQFSMGIDWLKSTLGFNTVEGFNIGVNLYANKRFKDSVTSLNNTVNFGYGFASKHFFFDVSSKWSYNPKRFASLEVFGGKHTGDFKLEEQNGKQFTNTLSSLFFRDNLIHYYDRTFAGVKHKIEVFNGFQTTVGLSYEQQLPLENRSDYSFFFGKKREYRSNIPDNQYLAANPDFVSAHTMFLLDISLSYTPKMFYRFSENKKVKYYVRSKYPTFTLSWRKAINKVFGSNSDFDYLELNIAQTVDLILLKNLKYNLSTGFFPQTKDIHFSQYKHFQTNNFWVVFNPFYGAFNTMPSYRYSSNEWFVAGHLKFEAPYLMLKFIPGFNKTLITENLHLSFLSNPLTKGYVEVGYSLSKIYFLGNIGVFVGFDEFKDVYWSIRAGFSLFE